MKIVFVIGKSGSGKDTILKNVDKFAEHDNLNVKRWVMHTTRPIRPNEEDGKDYYFDDIEKYKEYQDNNDIVESREYHISDNESWYYYMVGSDLEESNNIYLQSTPDAILKIEEYFKKKYPDINFKDICEVVYIDANDTSRLFRSIKRESLKPKDEINCSEICRRFLAEEKEFDMSVLDGYNVTTLDNSGTDKMRPKLIATAILKKFR